MAEGYEIPLHRSLTEPILMAGAPRSAAIAIGTLAAALALGLRLWIPGALPLGAWAFSGGVHGAQRSGFHGRRKSFHAAQGASDMLNLKEYADTPTLLADYLPWACIVAPGVVLNKDGSFQTTFKYRGPDLESLYGRRTGFRHGAGQ